MKLKKKDFGFIVIAFWVISLIGGSPIVHPYTGAESLGANLFALGFPALGLWLLITGIKQERMEAQKDNGNKKQE